MAKIKINVPFGPLRGLVGVPEIEIEAETIKEVIEKLKQKYGDTVEKIFFDEEGKEYPFHIIIFNGKRTSLKEIYNKKLQTGDELTLWPALDGG